ncbi:transcriptional regulator [Sphingomonas sp. So64.6b]|uniref:transcriptional regulator n=1 Tax=Sphingomonas sp. So64.6b TaxID=2997354 RepID=UPI001602A11D|nr:transcriptional regulator [Sphingomonas sp. So64.6b]QNA83791.1 transcriptional regulator [Sphingomonas sp. So64.6b]
MLVFLDFEASSLAKRSYPIEVAWVFANGRSESHLIMPAPDWTDSDADAEAIHRIDRGTLLLDGTPHRLVAQRMMDVLAGHDLLASAPSWDGKWLSALLRAAGLPRHSLRLRRTDEALRECAATILGETVPHEMLASAVDRILARYDGGATGDAPAHRALPAAEAERARWLAVWAAARALAAEQGRH